MTKALFVKDHEGNLQPTNEAGEKIMRRTQPGEMVLVERKANRNYKFLKKYFALINELFDMQDNFEQKEIFRQYMLVAVGHCDLVPSPKNGELMPFPKSISFDAMPDDDEFSEIYTKTIPAFMDRFAKELTKTDLNYLYSLN